MTRFVKLSIAAAVLLVGSLFAAKSADAGYGYGYGYSYGYRPYVSSYYYAPVYPSIVVPVYPTYNYGGFCY